MSRRPGSRRQASAESPSQQVAAANAAAAAQQPQDEVALTAVRGLKLEPQAPEAKKSVSVVNSLAALWAVALLLALGAWQQSRRWRGGAGQVSRV